MQKNDDRIYFSVIVPVYNVKKYLRQCVRSIAEQGNVIGTYEILLIDDGSCDGSGKACDELQEKYPVIRVLHQKNAGLGAARNTGIRAANGEYLLFVDADDFIGKGSLCTVFQQMKNHKADLYFLKSYKYYEMGKRCAVNEEQLGNVNYLKKKECMQLFAGLSRYPGAAWDKLVRRDFIEKYHLYFEENVFSEDLLWVLKCLLFAESYYYIETDYYYYRQGRFGSITDNLDGKRVDDLLHAIRQGIILAKSPAGRYFQKEIYSMMAYEAEVALLFSGMLPGTERKHFLEKTQEVLWLLKYRKVRRTQWIRFFIKRVGTERASVLLKYLYFVKKRCYGER